MSITDKHRDSFEKNKPLSKRMVQTTTYHSLNVEKYNKANFDNRVSADLIRKDDYKGLVRRNYDKDRNGKDFKGEKKSSDDDTA